MRWTKAFLPGVLSYGFDLIKGIFKVSLLHTICS